MKSPLTLIRQAGTKILLITKIAKSSKKFKALELKKVLAS